MNAQQAAFQILREVGGPLSSKEIANRVLTKGLLRSNARSPIDSIAQTIEKNVRDGVYNHPELEFVRSVEGRLIGIAGAKKEGGGRASSESIETPGQDLRSPPGIAKDEARSVALPALLVNKIDLCVMVGMGPSREALAAEMLRRGLEQSSEEIMLAIRKHIAETPRE